MNHKIVYIILILSISHRIRFDVHECKVMQYFLHTVFLRFQTAAVKKNCPKNKHIIFFQKNFINKKYLYLYFE
jgi:hypothetical protein